jgi:hypothetical protein
MGDHWAKPTCGKRGLAQRLMLKFGTGSMNEKGDVTTVTVHNLLSIVVISSPVRHLAIEFLTVIAQPLGTNLN